MSSEKFGVKVYSYDWHLNHGLSPDQAAERLKNQGIDFAVVQNRYVPMASSAVESGLSDHQQAKLEALDDRDLTRALQEVGLEYWAACNVFFAPDQLEQHPECRPVDQFGLSARKIDWYVGICPSCESYWKKRKAQIVEAVKELQPYGVFLGFIRFPGFWELWLPRTERADWPEFCFCSRCRNRFAEEMGIDDFPERDADPQTRIRSKVYEKFVKWKTDLITERVREISKSVSEVKPGTEIMVNTLPFIEDDFSSAGREVFGQDKRKLSSVTDVFELMTYHQMLGRKLHWIGNTIRRLRKITNRPVSSTIQVKPYYTEGMHAGRGRETQLSPKEFERAISIARNAGAERISFFTWADLLESETKENILENLP